MNQQEAQEQTRKILAILQPVWPQSGLDKAAIPAWTLALDGLDSGLLQAAAAEWVRTEKWFPKPFELISLAREIEEQQISSGVRSLPEPRNTIPLTEQVATLQRIVALAEQMGIKNKHIHRAIVNLNAEACAAGIDGIDVDSCSASLGIQERIEEYLRGEAA